MQVGVREDDDVVVLAEEPDERQSPEVYVPPSGPTPELEALYGALREDGTPVETAMRLAQATV